MWSEFKFKLYILNVINIKKVINYCYYKNNINL